MSDLLELVWVGTSTIPAIFLGSSEIPIWLLILGIILAILFVIFLFVALIVGFIELILNMLIKIRLYKLLGRDADVGAILKAFLQRPQDKTLLK